jgi:hypothetical protein
MIGLVVVEMPFLWARGVENGWEWCDGRVDGACAMHGAHVMFSRFV